MSRPHTGGIPLTPGVNVDKLDIAAGMRELRACGFEQSFRRDSVITYALQRWARGEEAAADVGATDKSFHGIDMTSWRRVLAAAMAAAQEPASNPPLGPCPPWCQLPAGHDWEDQWKNGPIREHTWRKVLSQYHSMELREYEQHTDNGPVRMQEVMLNVESPTQLDVDTAATYLVALSEAIALARLYPPQDAGEVA